MDPLQIQLWQAVKEGDLDMVEHLIAVEGAEPDYPYEDRASPLILAANLGLSEMVQLLISYGAEVNRGNFINGYRMAPLLQAVVKGHTETAKILLQSGADPNVTNQLRQTPLHDAALFGFLEIGQALIERGADLDVQDHILNTPLHHATQDGHLAFISLLIQHGADRHIKNEGGATPLLLARAKERRDSMLRLLQYHHPALQAELAARQYSGAPDEEKQCRAVADFRRKEIRTQPNVVAGRFRAFVDQYPGFWMGHYGLGEALGVITANEQAYNHALETEKIKALEKACELAPRLREPLLELAKEYADLNLESAFAAYKKALAECDNAPCMLYPPEWQASNHFQIGVRAAVHANRDISLALEAFCHAILINPDYYGRETMPRSDLAREIWELALFVDPKLEELRAAAAPGRPEPGEPETENSYQEYFSMHQEIKHLHNQSIDLYQEFERNHSRTECLSQSIELEEQAYELAPPDYVHLKEIVHHLAVLYLSRFLLLREEEDLQRALEFSDLLVTKFHNTEAFYDRLQLRGAILFDAGTWFKRREYFEESIKTLEEAVENMKGKRPNPKVYGSLGLSYLEHYKFTSSLSELRAGIDAFERCLALATPNSIDRSGAYNNLGLGYRNLFEREGKLEYLDKAIDAFRSAIATVGPESRYYPMRLINLANGLQVHATHGDTPQMDLDEAIKLYELAVERTDEDHPLYFQRSISLSTALRNRYDTTKNRADLDRAAQIGENVLARAVPGSPDYPGFLLAQAATLSALDKKGNAGKISDYLEKGVRLGADSPLVLMVEVATRWVDWEFEKRDWDKVEKAYDHARLALNKVFKTQLWRKDKETWLKTFQGMALKAAYALACQDEHNKHEKAAEILEEGLGRLISEALTLDAFALKQLELAGHAALVERFRVLSGKIAYLQAKEDDQADWSKEIKTHVDNLEILIWEIRKIPGFSHFLMPLSISELYDIAEKNPLVYIFYTAAGGMALAVDGKRKQTAPILLDALTRDNSIQKLLGQYADYVFFEQSQSRAAADHKGIGPAGDPWEGFLPNALSNLWDWIMQPVVNYLPKNEPATLIPAGLLNFLPLHAAFGDRHALDYLPFNYAPNAAALKGIHAPDQEGSGIFIVDEPENASNPLPNSRFEALAISSFFIDYEILKGRHATNASVKTGIRGDYLAYHFSCHGNSRIDQPLESFLALAGVDRLTLKEMLNQNISARLIALSACETSVIGASLPDESISLSSGFLQAGVQGVIGSLWKVYDLSTMLTMVKFYDLWKRKKKIPVIAFNEAVKWLRDSRSEAICDYLIEIDQRIQELRPNLYEPGLNENNLRSLRQRPGEQPFSDPAHWAGFIFSGD